MIEEERRYDILSRSISIDSDDERDEPRQSLSDLLDKKRADALAKEAAEEQAKKLDALDEKLNRPFTAGDLEHKTGGPDTDVIDNFFADDSEPS